MEGKKDGHAQGTCFSNPSITLVTAFPKGEKILMPGQKNPGDEALGFNPSPFASRENNLPACL